MSSWCVAEMKQLRSIKNRILFQTLLRVHRMNVNDDGMYRRDVALFVNFKNSIRTVIILLSVKMSIFILFVIWSKVLSEIDDRIFCSLQLKQAILYFIATYSETKMKDIYWYKNRSSFNLAIVLGFMTHGQLYL